MKNNFFQKILTFFMLIIMNAPPVITNLMSIRTAAVVASSIYTPGLFANDLTIEDLKKYGGEGADFGMGLLSTNNLGSYSTGTSDLEVMVDGEAVNFDINNLFDTSNTTDEKILSLYNQDKDFTEENMNDDISTSISDRGGELKTEESGQGDAYRLLYGCDLGDDCNDPQRSDNWKEQRALFKDKNNPILIQQNEILKDDINNPLLEGLTEDCKTIKRIETTSKTKWIKDIKTCNENVPVPLVGSCKVTRIVKKIPAIQNVVGARFQESSNSFIFDHRSLNSGGQDGSGGGCGQYLYPIDFYVPNVNAITTMELTQGSIDDILSIIVNGKAIWSFDGHGAVSRGGNRAFIVPNGTGFRTAKCLKNDYNVVGDDVEVNIDECLNRGLTEPYNEFEGNNNQQFYDVGLNSAFYIHQYRNVVLDGGVRTTFSGQSSRVLRSQTAVDIFKELKGISILNTGEIEQAKSLYAGATTCEYSADVPIPRVDIRPFLVQGDNTITLEMAVGGGGDLAASFHVVANAYTDEIIQEPANCVSNPSPGWGAALDESIIEPGIGSTKRWKCTDLDNNRSLNGVPITPVDQGFMFTEMFNLDDPKKNICYEAIARKYENDLSTLKDSGCFYEQDGSKKCYDSMLVDTMSLNTCETKGYTSTCNLIDSTCKSTNENGVCTSYYKKYDCGQEFEETIQTEVEDYFCPGGLSCLGDECFSQDREKNGDFAKIAGAASAANQIAKEGPGSCSQEDWIPDYDRGSYEQYTDIIDGTPTALKEKPYMKVHPNSQKCNCELKDNDAGEETPFDMNDPDSARQIIDVSTCGVFAGKKYSCKEVGAVQDCCDYPGEVNIVQYIQMAMMLEKTGAYKAAWELAKEVPGVGAVGDVVKGAGDNVTGYLSDGWNSIAENINDGIGSDLLGTFGEDAASGAGAEGLMSTTLQNMNNAMAEWTGEALGDGIKDALFSENDITGNFELGGAGTALDTFNTVMMYYQAYKLFVQIVYKCEDSEYEMGYKTKLKSCHSTGGYCDQKFLGWCFEWVNTACCYDGPLARILSEQAYDQLDISWNNGKNPNCKGLTVEKLDLLDTEQLDLSEYYEILSTNDLIPSGSNAASLFDLDGTTKGLGRELDAMNGTSNANPDSNVQTRTGVKTQNSDPSGDKAKQKNCLLKDVFDFSIDGSEGDCVYDCGPNSLWNDNAQECQCVEGSYKDSNGKCSVNKECPSHQKFDPSSASCVADCGFFDDELSAGDWSGSITVKGGGPNVADTCDGNRYNPFSGTYTKECLDVDETSHWYGGWLGTGSRRSVFSTREIGYFPVWRCKTPEPIALTGADCAEVSNLIERNACNNACSRLDSFEDQRQCRSLRSNCDFSKKYNDAGSLVISERSQCVSEVLSGVEMPGDMCNSYTDDISRLACLDQCSFTSGLSVFENFRCSTLASRCDIADTDDKKLCIDVLRNGSLDYGEDQCSSLSGDEREACIQGTIPSLKTNILNNWCNSTLSASETCNAIYDDETEINACLMVANDSPVSGESCLPYLDDSREIGYTTIQKATFDNNVLNIINYINNSNEQFIQKVTPVPFNKNGLVHLSMDVNDGGIEAKLNILFESGLDVITSGVITESYVILNNRPGYKYNIELSAKALGFINNYIK